MCRPRGASGIRAAMTRVTLAVNRGSAPLGMRIQVVPVRLGDGAPPVAECTRTLWASRAGRSPPSCSGDDAA